MELLIFTVINILDVLGVTAWGKYFSQKKNKPQNKTKTNPLSFETYTFLKTGVDHSRHMLVCLGAVTVLTGASLVPVPIRSKVFPQVLTTNHRCQVTPGLGTPSGLSGGVAHTAAWSSLMSSP